MKIRNGFISNSSSSSFVIAFPRKPKSVEEAKKMLFGKQEWHYTGYGELGERDVPTLPIAMRVFAKIKKKATKTEIWKSIKDGWFSSSSLDFLETLPGYKSRDIDDIKELLALKHLSPEWHTLYNKIAKAEDQEDDKRAEAIADRFMRINNKSYFVVMDFSDNDGESIEEHTDIFARLSHIRTSYH